MCDTRNEHEQKRRRADAVVFVAVAVSVIMAIIIAIVTCAGRSVRACRVRTNSWHVTCFMSRACISAAPTPPSVFIAFIWVMIPDHVCKIKRITYLRCAHNKFSRTHARTGQHARYRRTMTTTTTHNTPEEGSACVRVCDEILMKFGSVFRGVLPLGMYEQFTSHLSKVNPLSAGPIPIATSVLSRAG